MQESDKMVACPYNNQHTMPESRLMWHLDKCPDGNRLKHLFSVCPYNNIHRVPRPHYEDHIRTCSDRVRNEDKIQEINAILMKSQPKQDSSRSDQEYIPGLNSGPIQAKEFNPWADYVASQPDQATEYSNPLSGSQSRGSEKRGRRTRGQHQARKDW